MNTMVLSREQTHKLRAVLQDLDPTAPQEQRLWPRHKVSLDMWIRTISPRGRTGVFKIMAMNLSKRGVGLLSKKLLSVGEKFALPLRFDEGGGKLVLCQVRNCRRLENGHCRVGATFLAWAEDEDGTTAIPAEWSR